MSLEYIKSMREISESNQNFPRTSIGWVEHGPSNRPVNEGISDLITHNYRDKEEIKAERVGMAGIISLRAYQVAKPLWIEQVKNFPVPSTREITSIETLKVKNTVIGDLFVHSMIEGLYRDEYKLTSTDDDTNMHALGAYNRLERIVYEVEDSRKDEGLHVKTTLGERVYDYASPVVNEVYAGVPALPGILQVMMDDITSRYEEKFGKLPDIQTTLDIMNNSYESFVEPRTTLHRVEGDALLKAEKDPKKVLSALEGNTLVLSSEAKSLILQVRKDTRATRARTATCPFLISTEKVEKYLDKPADFHDPMKDAFDQHMRMLAA